MTGRMRRTLPADLSLARDNGAGAERHWLLC